MFEQRERGAREESETNVVVFEAVDRRTCEELWRVEQVSRCARGITEQKTNQMNLAAPLNAHVVDSAAIQQRSIDLLVKWKDELRVDIQLSQSFRQSARYVRQPAGLGKRNSFRSQDGDTHLQR